MTPLEHDHNIDILLCYRNTNYDEYATLLYNEHPDRTFLELDDPPDLLAVQTNQELILLITEVELIVLRRSLSEEDIEMLTSA